MLSGVVLVGLLDLTEFCVQDFLQVDDCVIIVDNFLRLSKEKTV